MQNKNLQIQIGDYFIRNWRMDDVPALTRYANNRQVSINLRDSFPFPYREADARAWIQAVRSMAPETHFAIASSSEAIGGIGLVQQTDVYHHSAELGYWLAEPFWGKGIATSAVTAFVPRAFTQFHLLRIYAGVFDRNLASVRVLEKAGFRLEGRLKNHISKDGEILDELLYAVTVDPSSD